MYKIASVGNFILGTEGVAFDSAISLTDFDIVIVDPSAISSSFPRYEVGGDNRKYIVGKDAHVISELIGRRKSEVSALLNNGKLIISFLNPVLEVIISSKYLDRSLIDNYSWIPSANLKMFTHQMINGLGSGVRIFDNKNLFTPYYYAFQKDLIFGAYLDAAPDKFRYGEPFIVNSANRVIGFTAGVSNGVIAFLPPLNFNEEKEKKFIGVVLQIAKQFFGASTKTPPPEWINSYTVPGVSEFQKSIEAVEKDISDLVSRKQGIEMEKNLLDDYKFLLYEQGRSLENKILDAFKLMGFNAETKLGENTDFDVILESNEGVAIAEVEGKDDNAVHKEKIDQLLSAVNQDAEQRGSFAKGVLVGNHYRLKPIEKRDQPFTETVMRLAKQYHYSLLTTAELFRATVYFLEHPDDEITKKACRMAIFETDGEVVQFPLPKK